MCQALGAILQLKEIQKQCYDRYEELTKEISEVDQEITDINHFIEFNILSASKGYKTYKMLQERLLRRRTIKDEMMIWEYVKRNNLGNFKDQGNVDKYVHNMEKRKYNPRVLKELFDS